MDPHNFQLPLEHWLFIIGIGLLVIEIAFFGFATFVLFFVGIAMLIVGALMAFGVLPVGIDIAIGAVSLLSISGAVLLWKPMKKIQSSKEAAKVEVGFVGHQFQVQTDIAPDLPGTYTYSGIAWTVVSDTAIQRFTQVQVIKADVGQLTVMPAEVLSD
jgi:membrane protein implicated in regulation of membrane protease activity|tara:strand:+ start:354 stop:827 length:474 start_codon:yes stop_codon:yes gene_type:complete